MNAFRVAVVALLIAFAMRAGVPPGFMVAVAEAGDGGIQIVICTTQTSNIVIVDANGEPVDPDGHEAATPTCAYGPPPFATAAVDAVTGVIERTTSRILHQRTRAYAIKARVREFRLARGPPLQISA